MHMTMHMGVHDGHIDQLSSLQVRMLCPALHASVCQMVHAQLLSVNCYCTGSSSNSCIDTKKVKCQQHAIVQQQGTPFSTTVGHKLYMRTRICVTNCCSGSQRCAPAETLGSSSRTPPVESPPPPSCPHE